MAKLFDKLARGCRYTRMFVSTPRVVVRHLTAIDRLGNRADQAPADGPAAVPARVKRMP